MTNDDMTLLAFILAMVLAGFTFLLVQHFSDEFERAYTGAPVKRLIMLPIRAANVLVAFFTALFTLR